MSDRDGLIWMNGKFVPWRDASVHVLTHTLHYGMGVFEGIRCYQIENGGAVFRLADHIERLFNSAKIFEIKIPYDENSIHDRSFRSNHEKFAEVLLYQTASVLWFRKDGFKYKRMFS